MSLILEKPSAWLPRAWVDGMAACKRLEPVGVIACKHVWADIVRDPMVRPCVKCGKEGGLRKWMISASDLQMHSYEKVEYSPRVRICLPSK